MALKLPTGKLRRMGRKLEELMGGHDEEEEDEYYADGGQAEADLL